ncbi:MAG: CPBP family intramembrane metalloprotease [Lachnospiraceae bacterium]|nr:CPBP family intramembrane metalloprotease [Lachnospiraceae bacterium]
MRRLRTLVKKEIMDILRDKKTLIIMVIVPLLLYPSIIIGMTLVMNMVFSSQEEQVYTVGYPVAGIEEEIIPDLQRLYEENEEELVCKLTFLSEEELQSGHDVWLLVEQREDSLYAEIAYASTDQASNYAESALSELLDLYKEELLKEKLNEEGLEEQFLQPLVQKSIDSATESESMGMSLGGSIGMLLITTILLGAFYPAVDITTGEKERGTLETLLTLPVTNFQMIMSKYIAVSMFACATAVLSIVALGGSVLFLVFGVSTELAAEFQGISVQTVIVLVLLLLLAMITTALLITAICMCFCVFAKSNKEANNYMTPVMLIIMFASMVGMIPSVELNYQTALIPLVNVSLLMKQLLAQHFDFAVIGVTIAVNFAYSIIIIWILAKMYDSENVLFQDGFQSIRLFQKRSEFEKGTVPAVGDLVMSIVVILLLVLYVGSAVSVRSTFAGTIVNQVIIFAVPVLVTWYMKSNQKELFSFKKPKKGTIPGSIVLYLGTYCLEMAIAGILIKAFPASAENVSMSFEQLAKQPVILMLIVMALMPAIGEEICFRGFLYGGLKNKYGVKWAVVLSAIVFGAFHMSLVKLLPTAMLGACLAYIVSVSGSIYIGMVLHFVNNAFSMLQMKYPDVFAKLFPVFAKPELTLGDTLIFMGVGLIMISIGIPLLKKQKNKT